MFPSGTAGSEVVSPIIMPNKERCEMKAEKGECYHCKQPALPGYRLCAWHHESNLKASRRYAKNHPEQIKAKKKRHYKNMKTEHRCLWCYNILLDGMGSMCPNCMDRG
jgi:hypothetical protein